MLLNPKIFRAYDLRGQAFVDFDEDGFFVTAAAVGRFVAQKYNLTQPKFFVSGDSRISMPELWPAVVAGLQSVGCDVVWGGAIPTPINLFARHEGDFDAAIQISASHNPAQDNGLKLSDRNGSICGEQIQKIRELAECEPCRRTIDFGECADGCQVVSFVAKYQAKLDEVTAPQDKKSIVVDAGNAIPGISYPEILESFGHTVSRLHCGLDTTFPNHQPDPEEVENMQDLVKKVQEVQADFGFAYDGDGDRVGIVLHDGTVLSADHILYVLAADFLSRNPGENIVVDAMSSAVLIEKIQKLGGNVILCPTGHSYIEQAMHTHNAKFGGEQSGHFMFGEDWYGHDDAMLASLRFVSAVEYNPELIEEVTTHWSQMHEYAEKFVCEDEKKFEILESVRTELLKQFPDAWIEDGIRIDFGKSAWGIVRCSNTTPKISIRVQAGSAEDLEAKKAVFVGALTKFL